MGSLVLGIPHAACQSQMPGDWRARRKKGTDRLALGFRKVFASRTAPELQPTGANAVEIEPAEQTTIAAPALASISVEVSSEDIRPAGRRIFVARGDRIPVPDDQNDRFTSDIQGRLYKDLEELKRSLERSLVHRTKHRQAADWILHPPVLRMTGKSRNGQVTLSPRIWVPCPKHYRRRVQKALDVDPFLQWTQSTEFGRIMLGEAPRLLSGRLQPLGPLGNTDGDADLILHIESIRDGSGGTLNGLVCRSTILRSGKVLGHNDSLIGGIVEIDGRAFGLTTAHGMMDGMRYYVQGMDPCSQNVIGGNLQGKYGAAQSASGEEKSISDGEYHLHTFQRDDAASASGWVPTRLGPAANFLGLEIVSVGNGGTEKHILRTNDSIQSDFALVDLGDLAHLSANQYANPRRNGATTHITTIVGQEDLTVKEVTIILKHRQTVTGTLLAGSSCLKISGVATRARAISLESPLGKSWTNQMNGIDTDTYKKRWGHPGLGWFTMKSCAE